MWNYKLKQSVVHLNKKIKELDTSVYHTEIYKQEVMIEYPFLRTVFFCLVDLSDMYAFFSVWMES